MERERREGVAQLGKPERRRAADRHEADLLPLWPARVVHPLIDPPDRLGRRRFSPAPFHELVLTDPVGPVQIGEQAGQRADGKGDQDPLPEGQRVHAGRLAHAERGELVRHRLAAVVPVDPVHQREHGEGARLLPARPEEGRERVLRVQEVQFENGWADLRVDPRHGDRQDPEEGVEGSRDRE